MIRVDHYLLYIYNQLSLFICVYTGLRFCSSVYPANSLSLSHILSLSPSLPAPRSLFLSIYLSIFLSPPSLPFSFFTLSTFLSLSHPSQRFLLSTSIPFLIHALSNPSVCLSVCPSNLQTNSVNQSQRLLFKFSITSFQNIFLSIFSLVRKCLLSLYLFIFFLSKF